MKQGWQIKKLGEVCESRLGKTLNSTTDTGELRPYLCAVNVQWDRFDLSYVKEALFENDEIEKYTAKKGDLLVCEGGETGRAAIWDKDEPIQYQNALHRIRFEDNTIIPRFCLHYLHFLKLSGVLDKEYSHGATILHLVTKSLHSIPIPVPSISEQQRIVSLLDAEFAKIDALKANAEKNLQNAKDLFQAALKKELEPKEGWKWSYLPAISENLDSKRIPITQKDRIAGIYPYYGASGIVDYVSEYLFDDDLLLISEDGANLLARSTPIAFSVSGKIWVNNHAHILKFKDMATQKIVEYYFASILINEYITGAAQPKLTQANLNKIGIPIPPTINDQQTIVARLDVLNEKCKTLQANYEKTLTLCDDLKQALLRKAFNGEI